MYIYYNWQLEWKKKKDLIHVQLFKQHVKEWGRLHQQTHSYKRPLCRQLEKALQWKWAWHPTSISADRTTTGDTTAPSRRADFHLPSNWWLPLCRAEKQKPAWKTTDRHRDDDPRMSLWKMSLMSQRESERAGERVPLIAQTFGDVSAIKELISLHFSGDSLSAKVTSIDGASP